MTQTLLLLLLWFMQQPEVHAYASMQSCEGWQEWIRGGDYEEMNVNGYSTNSTACRTWVEPATDTYEPGQLFTLYTTPISKMGIKTVLLGGAEFVEHDTRSMLDGKTCLNADQKEPSSKSTFRAPMQGTVTIKTLCGKLTVMHIADDVVLAPAATDNRELVESTSPTTSPFTLGESTEPTISPFTLGGSAEPTVSPTASPTLNPSAIITEAPTTNEDEGGDPSTSKDPAYKYEKQLNSMMTLYYKQNKTHGAIKLTKQGAGYLAFGVGDRMIASSCIVAMDLSRNPDYSSAFALYKIQDIDGTLTALANTPIEMMQRFALHDLSYTTSKDKAELKFVIDLRYQSDNFRMFRDAGYPYAPPINIVYAGGPTNGEYTMHPLFGSLSNVDFSRGKITSKILDWPMMVHIVTMLLAWGVFIPLSVIARLREPSFSPTKWLQLHTWLSCIGIALNIVGYYAGWYYVKTKHGIHLYDQHGKLGLAIFIIAFLQPVMGFSRHLFTKREYFSLTHIGIGFALLAMGFVNNVLGVNTLQLLFGSRFAWQGKEYKSGYFNGMLGWSVLTITVAFGIGTLLVFKLRLQEWIEEYREEEEVEQTVAAADVEEGLTGESLHTPLLLSSTSELASSSTTTAAEQQQRTITRNEYENSPNLQMFEGGVYDFTSYLDDHPGGGELITEAGKDITEEFHAQGHSKKATRMLKKYLVGVLVEEERENSTISTPLVQTPSPPPPTVNETVGHDRIVTLQEFRASPNLQLFEGGVYDFTSYLDDHPGGGDLITEAGKDITEEFHAQGHSKKAARMLKKYYVGALGQCL